MNEKTIVWIFCFVIAGAMCAILFFAGGLSWKEKMKLPAPRPDVVVTITAPQGTVLIENKTAGYAITVPRDWYLEKNAGNGITVYPNYDIVGHNGPDCKIEIATLSDPGGAALLSAWLTAYLHRDPTADISETSRTEMIVNGMSAIAWNGALNGTLTSLAYVATGTNVYEIAPSLISEKKNGSMDIGCENVLQVILANFHFIK
jgi:hypothetical protein